MEGRNTVPTLLVAIRLGGKTKWLSMPERCMGRPRGRAMNVVRTWLNSQSEVTGVAGTFADVRGVEVEL